MSLFGIGDREESAEADDAAASDTAGGTGESARSVSSGGLAGNGTGGEVDFGVLVDGASELDVGVGDIETAYPADAPNDAAARQARTLSTVCQREDGTARADRVSEVAAQQAAAGVPPSAYVGSYAGALEAMVDAAFDAVADGADPETAREDLKTGVRAAMADASVGTEQFEAEGESDTGTAGATHVGMEELFEALPYPAFLVDDEHTVLEYNLGLRRVLSLDDDHREFLGKDNRDTIAAATYTDDRRHRSLVDKVAENPRDAEQHWEIDRVDDGMPYTEHIVYEDTSLTKDPQGNETHIRFYAVPLFDGDGDLKAVFELVEDRTEEIQHEKTVSELIGEVTETLRAIGDGDLSARASYEDEYGVVNPALLNLTDEVNEMASDFEGLVERVDETTVELTASIDQATDAAERISEQVDTQTQATAEAASRVEEFSASMEEVATTANEVAAAADAALEEADRGRDAGEDAQAVTAELTDLSDDLVDTVEELDRYMDEVGEVVDVMAEVAKQTNLLALNANIEAARVDQSGEGFAVVADEVKSLATQAQEHTDEIADRIELIQRHADDTVSEVETSYEYVQEASREMQDAVDALETVSGEVEDVAVNIQEVADANDRQAENVQEVMAQLDALQDSSDEVADTTAEIVEMAETQERIVGELSDRVHALSTGADD